MESLASYFQPMGAPSLAFGGDRRYFKVEWDTPLEANQTGQQQHSWAGFEGAKHAQFCNCCRYSVVCTGFVIGILILVLNWSQMYFETGCILLYSSSVADCCDLFLRPNTKYCDSRDANLGQTLPEDMMKKGLSLHGHGWNLRHLGLRCVG